MSTEVLVDGRVVERLCLVVRQHYVDLHSAKKHVPCWLATPYALEVSTMLVGWERWRGCEHQRHREELST
jgi:hypothetical protein